MKQRNKLQKELEGCSISLKKFLVTYCGVDIKQLENLNMSHKDIKVLIPNLKRVSFEEANNNIKALYVGKIIAVKDCYGDIAPYVCPNLEETLIFEAPLIEEKELEKIEKLMMRNDLNLNELILIRKKLRAYKKFKECRIINKILRSKVDFKVKRYKKEKDNLRRESEQNEY